ncbi:hypothetical protein ANN_00732 [Periplaneta americana]|uniref:Uncharacterized protein n=1 Tax=Periplaneta americana TaxID=6978 RepID=A0ABQ8TRL9_PERAM|nr:hypothetical protein ANN_00732 [Periplaneta americana]
MAQAVGARHVSIAWSERLWVRVPPWAWVLSDMHGKQKTEDRRGTEKQMGTKLNNSAIGKMPKKKQDNSASTANTMKESGDLSNSPDNIQNISSLQSGSIPTSTSKNLQHTEDWYQQMEQDDTTNTQFEDKGQQNANYLICARKAVAYYFLMDMENIECTVWPLARQIYQVPKFNYSNNTPPEDREGNKTKDFSRVEGILDSQVHRTGENTQQETQNGNIGDLRNSCTVIWVSDMVSHCQTL